VPLVALPIDMKFMQWLSAVWHRVREPLTFLKPLRFVIVPQLVLFWATSCSDQGKDTMRRLVEFSAERKHPVVLGWFVVSVLILALQSWYWSRQLLRVDFHHTPTQYAAGGTKLERYAPRWIGGFAFFIAIVSLLLLLSDHAATFWILLTVALLVVAAVTYAWFVIKRRDFWPKLGRDPKRISESETFGETTRKLLHGTAIAGIVLIVWTAIDPLRFAWVFPSPPLLMISATIWVGIGSWLVLRADRYRVPLFGMLFVMAAVFSCWNDNHNVRKGDRISTPRPTIEQQFTTWYGGLPGANQPVFIVATEGGGIRAAYWTAAVLAELQDRAPAFSDHLFAISGVSGGSIGAAVFTGLVADGKCDAQHSYRDAVKEILGYDALAPTLARFLQADLAQRFIPVPIVRDRQRALEAGWLAGWKKRQKDDLLDQDFIATYRSSGKRLPSLFLNGTVVESGNRTISSNCAFLPTEIRDAHDTIATLGTDLPLISAAGNSARFPYISPAGTLRGADGKVVEHVVDGGYFEDSGTATAAEIIAAIRKTRPTLPVYLIIIRSAHIPEKTKKPEHYLNEIASPLRALIAAWGAHTTLAVVEAHQIDGIAKPIDFVLGEVPNDVKLPLGWLLAERSQVRIDAEVGMIAPEGLPAALRPTVDENAKSVQQIMRLLAAPAMPTNSPVQDDALKQERQLSK